MQAPLAGLCFLVNHAGTGVPHSQDWLQYQAFSVYEYCGAGEYSS
jgi:hypothetical protein